MIAAVIRSAVQWTRLLPAIVLFTAVFGCATATSRPDVAASPALSASRGDTIDEDRPTDGVDRSGAITSVSVTRESWRFGDYEGQIITTPHYRLYTTLPPNRVLDRLPLFLERALAQYTTALAQLPAPRTRMETYLFGTRNQWEAKTRLMLPRQAAKFLTLGRGGYTTRGTSVLYYIGRSDTLAIAAHEGWHQYSQRTFGNQLPIWLEEGIATYMEGYVSHPDGNPKFRPWANLERYHTLRNAVRAGRLIPLEELLQRSPQSFLDTGKNKLLIYYAQVWSLAHFIAEGEHGRYREGLQQVLLDAARGRLAARRTSSSIRRSTNRRVGPWLLQEYLTSDLAAFEQQYLQFVRGIVKTGGRGHIVRGENPLNR